jgi:hypothetical protein
MSHSRMGCLRNDEINYRQIIQTLELTEFEKLILHLRYIKLLDKLHGRTSRITYLFYVNKTIVTIGSLIVPALLSIQYADTGPGADKGAFSAQIYWSTWVLSLLVTICNALMTLFKIDKKFMYLHSDIEYLISEGWQYAQLSGRYSGFYTPGEVPTHKNQFKFFCHIIEKIQMKEVESEYSNKLENSAAHQNSTKKTSSIDTTNPITPLRPGAIETIEEYLQEVKQDENTSKSLVGNGGSQQSSSPRKDTDTQNDNNSNKKRRASETSENSQVSVHINMQESTNA